MNPQVQPYDINSDAPFSPAAESRRGPARNRRGPGLGRAGLLGALLAPALLVGGTTPAAAGVTGPWSTPVALSATGADTVHVAEVRTAGNGDVVAASFRQSPGSAQTDLQVAIRPAGSAVWGTPTVVDTLPAGTANARLFTAPDGSVTLTWVKLGAQDTVRTAVLASGGTAFSAPADIATGTDYIAPTTAVGANGRAVTAWIRQGDRITDVYVSERANATAAWSAPVKLDSTPAETLESSLEALITPDGTATVVWGENRADGASVVSSDLVAGATTWSTAAALSGAAISAAVPRASVAPDGSAVLSWLSHPSSAWGPDSLDVLIRPAGSTQWGAPQKAATVDSPAASRPLIGPDGQITMVWRGYTANGFHIQSTTRSPVTGAWSPTANVTTAYSRDEYDAEIGPDGSVHVLWTQQDDSGWSQVVHYAGRSGGVWSAPAALMAQPSGVAEGHVAGGPDGRTTAVWQELPDGVSGKVWSAGTGL
ncbi:hypothetical protein ACWDR0_02940 [Streptomyces sp. NPDC003691]